ncbi:acyltransferase family protein [Leucobacter sp. L43]|uniref:acyltransferase family protein n=1 Tax=Leucobacter sp. L43 TaxID=2798040 RepID=UPI00190420DF|nr:acyltransferase family protein [Leucobacter sp. L43]
MTAQAPPQQKPGRLDTPRYRDDIDGLRAVAVLLVVVYHVWLGRVSGGVDAFLMISAFLLTGSLMRRLETTGRVRVVTQWVRNFKRMLPAAAITIIATVLVGLLVLPTSAHDSLWQHARASVLYFENWLLAAESVDYYADTSLASPLQHFWSLSVQGQVFIVWPVLFLLIAVIARVLRGRVRPRVVAFSVFGLVFAASLTYSVITTATEQAFAYFNTGARLWEFALGSILALVLHRLHFGVIVRAVLGWAGLAALVACGMVLDVQSGFPGYLALWPVLSVAAVIVSGNGEDRRYGPAMFLETGPVLALGKSSYALYLVHWPILVFVLVARQGEPLNFVEGLIIILLSIGLANVLTRLVDAPLRRIAWLDRSNWRGIGVIAVSVALVLGPVTGLQVQAERAAAAELRALEQATERALTLRNPGAAVLFDSWADTDAAGAQTVTAPRRPLPAELKYQWGTLAHDCSDGSLVPLPDSVEVCFDNGVDASEAERTVVVIGNSHAQQMLEPIEQIADEQNWQAISFLYAACAFGLRDVDESRGIFYSQECRDWNEDVLDVIEDLDPDVVITIGTETAPADTDSPANAGKRERTLDGAERSLERLDEAGIPVVLIRDNPRFAFDSYQCAEQAERLAVDCSVTQRQALAATNPAESLVGANVATIDLSEYYCPDRTCPAVIGNVNVYTDDNHLSLVYAASLAPVLGQQLLDALDGFSRWR